MSDKKKLRDLSAEQTWLLRSMLNAFVVFESVFDDQGRFVSYRFEYINDAYERITGVTLEQVRGKTVHEVWPQTEPSWIEAYGKVAVTGETHTFDMYHQPTEKHYHCRVYRPWDTSERFCVVFEDITESRRTEQRLREKTDLLRHITDHMFDMVSLADTEGRFVWVSPSHATIGYTADDLLGRIAVELVHPEDLEHVLAAIGEGLESGLARTVECRYLRSDGTYVWLDSIGKFIFDTDGQPTGMIFSSRDISARRAAEETRKKLELQLLQAQKLESVGRLAGGAGPRLQQPAHQRHGQHRPGPDGPRRRQSPA